jgi:hypothetical protein
MLSSRWSRPLWFRTLTLAEESSFRHALKDEKGRNIHGGRENCDPWGIVEIAGCWKRGTKVREAPLRDKRSARRIVRARGRTERNIRAQILDSYCFSSSHIVGNAIENCGWDGSWKLQGLSKTSSRTPWIPFRGITKPDVPPYSHLLARPHQRLLLHAKAFPIMSERIYHDQRAYNSVEMAQSAITTLPLLESQPRT